MADRSPAGAPAGGSRGPAGRPHPDRLFPADPAVRDVARRLHEGIAGLPIVAVHGHVDAAVLRADRPFPDPATLLVTSDHYVLRALHGAGVPLDALGRGPEPANPEAVWRTFCSGWSALRGSATGLWLAQELTEVLGSGVPPRPEDFGPLTSVLATPALRPRALFARFGIELLSTTDPVEATFDDHLALQADGLAVVPTVRPDTLTDATAAGWVAAVEGTGATSCTGVLEVIWRARAASRAAGAVATDHGHPLPHTEAVDTVTAEVLFARVASGRADPGDAARLAGHLLLQMAVMALDDGLVMQLHTGVRRDHDRPGVARYGPDTGGDFPVPVTFTDGLRPLLERCGAEPGFRLVAFTVDESTWSRELAPMASYWPGLWLGAPWWFLDAPDAMARHLAAVAGSAGYGKLTGFVDDTRAYLSIPARHDLARRALAAHLAVAVAEHRLELADAAAIAADYAYHAPRAVYRCA